MPTSFIVLHFSLSLSLYIYLYIYIYIYIYIYLHVEKICSTCMHACISGTHVHADTI